ncbi:MAG: hypothetical protein ACQEVA_16020 [Myxococcota bacterium]
MLYAYVFCLIVGGAFVLLSVMSGIGDADADFDADMDADFDADFDADMDAEFDADVDADMDIDADADAEHGGGSGDVEVFLKKRFNPLYSFKFWTFFLAYFGLTGVVFEFFSLMEGTWGIFALSLGLGLFAGLFSSYLMYAVNKGGVSAGVTERDYVGSSAKVTLPLSGQERGKVRMMVKGKMIEMPAESADDDEVVFDLNEECFVLGVEDGVAKVVHPNALQKKST